MSKGCRQHRQAPCADVRRLCWETWPETESRPIWNTMGTLSARWMPQ